ncbi:hypothetical protein [Paludibaculum fermentans]|uniref:Restriction endonuclease n=1 Tax=Paludibaculum fermentans TaxID=1473598 RepID=A0A7S7SLF6_PALFE|nr:hypothetical protein [Paludibaculum fermentans]QOY88000.1 hypothetical protein IRI77_35575 [Paludibaculum fermentans]
MNTPIPLTTPVNKGIVTALDQVIDDFFGLSPINLSYANRSAYGKLCREKPQLDGAELVRRLLSRISENRSALTQAGTPVRGGQMWRFKKNLKLDPGNGSLEVRIERAIARLMDSDWVNQVPLSSGLTDGHEAKRSIDLVHRHSDTEYDFIELKALSPGRRCGGNQTPLFAAMEILQYGLIFLYCRENQEVLFPATADLRPLLRARIIHLEVLMTHNCYEQPGGVGQSGLAWLNNILLSCMEELNHRTPCLVSFTFAFKQFAKEFAWIEADHQSLVKSEFEGCWPGILRDKIQCAIAGRQPIDIC